jgi:hypothetical protein
MLLPVREFCGQLSNYTVITRMPAVAFLSKTIIQGGSNMTGTNCDLFTHNQSRSYLNHLVHTLMRPSLFATS